MRTHITKFWLLAAALLTLYASSVTLVNALQLASVADPSVAPPAGGGGDSVSPVLSPDGRYVLFTSTAHNLCLTTNNTPYRATFPPRLNVFLRDRTNATTTLVSVNASGNSGGNGDSIGLEISTNGRYALFESSASDLVLSDTNNLNDVFMRDLLAGTTRLVSMVTNGRAANGISQGSVMTADGRYVAFVSQANNLTPGDINGIADIFVRDLQSNTMTLVSAGAKSTSPAGGVGSSEAPAITPDGRYVAFYSTATNLVPGVQTVGEIYVRDLVAGVTHHASTHARTVLQAVMGTTNAVSSNHAISKDGKYVAFETSPATGSTLSAGVVLRYSLVTGLTDVVHTNAYIAAATAYEDIQSLDMTPDGRFIAFVANTNGITGATTCIRVWDAQTGQTVLASGNVSNAVPVDSICDWPTIDPTGRYVAFLYAGFNLVTNPLTSPFNLYVRDTQTGTTQLVNTDSNGVGYGVSFMSPSRLNVTGRGIAFQAYDGNLAPGDWNHAHDVFLRDLCGGTAELISARHPTLPSLTPNGSSGGYSLSASADGRYVAFASAADDVVANDTNKCTDIFVRDLAAATNYLVSSYNGLTVGNEPSSEASISADGRYVVFTSGANNLVAGDSNGARDVFVHNLSTRRTWLVSINTNLTGTGNAESYAPVINADGQRVLFRGKASNLAPVVSGSTNLFYRDMQAGTTYALTTTTIFGFPVSLGAPLAESMTPDGRWVAFVTALSGSNTNLYLWDSQYAMRVYTNTTLGIARVAISPNGGRLAFATASQLYVADWAAKITWPVGPMTPSSRVGMRFSANGRFLTYASTTAQALADNNGTYDVYLYDLQTQAKLLVSQSYGFAMAANAASDSPDISPDGRFVAYRSEASNLVLGDMNGAADVFLFDRLKGTTTLLSVSRFGDGPASGWSLAPRFTSDSRKVFFQSWASDLTGFDFNYQGDVFAYEMFYAAIAPGGLPAQGPALSWPVVAGRTYRVQFLDDLSNTNWQDAGGSITIVGEWGYFTDPAPAAGQQFYRIVAN